MDDDVLAATRILVIGGNRDVAESLREQLSAAGDPAVDLVDELASLVAHAKASQPQVVVSLGDVDPAAVRSRLDPLGLAAGPPVVPFSDLAADGEPSARRVSNGCGSCSSTTRWPSGWPSSRRSSRARL